MPKSNPDIFLENYREIKFKLNGKKILIGGFARPKHVSALCELVSNHQIGALVNLTGDDELAWAQLAGIDSKFYTGGQSVKIKDYFTMPLESTKIIPSSVYDNIYKAVTRAQNNQLKIAIHCGAGDGRTGTALAALVLRNVLKKIYNEDSEYLTRPAIYNQKIHVLHGASASSDIPGGECDINVTIAVKRAINHVRRFDNPTHQSVESANDVRTLLEYEEHLKRYNATILTARQLIALKETKDHESSHHRFFERSQLKRKADDEHMAPQHQKPKNNH